MCVWLCVIQNRAKFLLFCHTCFLFKLDSLLYDFPINIFVFVFSLKKQTSVSVCHWFFFLVLVTIFLQVWVASVPALAVSVYVFVCSVVWDSMVQHAANIYSTPAWLECIGDRPVLAECVLLSVWILLSLLTFKLAYMCAFKWARMHECVSVFLLWLLSISSSPVGVWISRCMCEMKRNLAAAENTAQTAQPKFRADSACVFCQ